MLLHLISNALKYSPSGTPVSVHLVYTPTSLILTVSDEGIGIPQDELSRLFESFFRGSNAANTPGTGLGGVIIRRAVEAHQGKIDIQSEVDAGTTVTVTLPLPPTDH